jgi:flagellin-specific chaperone FliS
MQIVSPTKTFDNLIANNNNNYALPEDVIDRITVLFDNIGFSTNTQNTYVNQYNAAPKAAPLEHDGRANYMKQQARKQNKTSWKTKPAFTVTKFALLDESENIIDELRIELNKINDKTIETRMSTIIQLLNNLLETASDNSDSDDNVLPPRLNDAFNMFFETAVTNKNPSLYAKFFQELHKQFADYVLTFVTSTYNAYIASFDNIVDVSETNYNEYCDFTAANIRRKNISALFAQIAVAGFLPGWDKEYMENLVSTLFTQVTSKVERKQKQKEVEEITDNIVTLFASLGTFIDKSRWTQVIESINQMKPSEKPGLTSRTKFKYMDLR